MLTFLRQPFPFTSSPAKRLKSAACISLFIFLFLYIFRPFGIGNIRDNILLITIGYGCVTMIITSLTTVLIPQVSPRFFLEEQWNTGKETLFVLLIITCISCGNIIYTSFLGYTTFTLSVFLKFELITLIVSLIPVITIILIKQNLLLKKNLATARDLSDSLAHKVRLTEHISNNLVIHAENPKDDFKVIPSEIYFIKAAENYVEIYSSDSGQMKKTLLRTTLKNAHNDIKSLSQFYRCHRTYLINLEKVKRVTGNAQGYRLVLEDFEESIPVSRGLNKDITLRLKR
ncbi:MAG: LytTR family DNA-binding domain-containing protein [Bacteroidota bacterium]